MTLEGTAMPGRRSRKMRKKPMVPIPRGHSKMLGASLG